MPLKHRTLGFLALIAFLVVLIAPRGVAQTKPHPLQLASLRPQQELRWHRLSPNSEKPDGPVLYQLLLNASGTPGTVPVFDTNPRHLINSPIIVNSGNVAIGGLSINGGTGIITFANGQTFPGNSGGTVTGLSAGAGISLSPSPITTTGSISIADGGVTAAKIGSGAAPNGQVLVANGSGNASWQTLNSALTNAWSLGGNTGTGCTTSPCTKFLGTTDNSALEFQVNGARVLRVEPATDTQYNYGSSPNVIAGSSRNLVTGAGTAGATIAGGGADGRFNIVSASFATVSGGAANAASSLFSTVAGGQYNTASGFASFAAGTGANTNHHIGAFVWSDSGSSNTSNLMATADNQFMVRANGGFKFIAGVDGAGNSDPTKTVSIAASTGIITFASGQTFPASGVPAWLLGGNAGTVAGANYIGTNDQQPFEVHVGNNGRAFRIEPQIDTNNNNSPAPNVIGGFSGNAATNGAVGATIAGGGESGSANTVSSRFGTVGGGDNNSASGEVSTVAGGFSNFATAFGATVGGGTINSASGEVSTAAGGEQNRANGEWSTVAGGFSNTASGVASTVAGGYTNTAGGSYSTVAGGLHNTANGVGSFAAGEYTSDGGQAGAFLWGDNSTTTVLSATGPNQFLVRATNGITFYTTPGLTTGVTVAFGGGSWASVSDRNVKANFAAIDGKQILARLVAMPVTTWNYKSQDASIRHLGPMAQDFYAAFQVGEDNRHITQVDEGGVAFAELEENVEQKGSQIATLSAQLAVQSERLRAQMQNKDAQISAQQRQIEDLQQQMRTMMARVEAVEKTSATHPGISLVASSQ